MKYNLLFRGKQFGFIGGGSMSLQLLKVLERWTEILDRDGCMNMIYCDFMKAFDTVPHGHLAQVLEYYNFDAYIVDWIRAFQPEMAAGGSEQIWIDMAWC